MHNNREVANAISILDREYLEKKKSTERFQFIQDIFGIISDERWRK